MLRFLLHMMLHLERGFLGGAGSEEPKEPGYQCLRRERHWGREDPLEAEMATHSSILTWRIPWTEEPGGLQSVESQRIQLQRHNWSDLACMHTRKSIADEQQHKLFQFFPSLIFCMSLLAILHCILSIHVLHMSYLSLDLWVMEVPIKFKLIVKYFVHVK